MTTKELEAIDGKDSLAVAAEEGRILRDLVSDHEPRVLLEVGTGHGYSTAWILSGMSRRARLLTIDQELRSRVCPESNQVTYLIGTLKGSIDLLPARIDFVFLDSDHQIHSIVEDIELLVPRLSDGAVVAVHDTVYCEEMGTCLAHYLAGVDSDHLKAIPLSPSTASWDYTNRLTRYGLGVAIFKKGTR